MITINGVSKTYRKRNGELFHALKDVDLTIDNREFLSIIGPSGCGKTTLLKMIAGLHKPDDGRIAIGDRVITGPGADRAMVFQGFVLLPWATVLANVTFGLEMRNVKKSVAKEKAMQQIERVGLEGFEKHYPHELSGGMQQRVGLARAMAVNPDILLMDEPFASVDAQTRQLLQEDLLRIWGGERSVVFVTHSMEEAVYLSDRIAVMHRGPGRVVEVIDVPFERPRDSAIRRDPRFGELTERIWESLRLNMSRLGNGAEDIA